MQQPCPNRRQDLTVTNSVSAGTVIFAGNSFGATDPEASALTYALQGTSPYFAIDSNTGDISTMSANIPAGAYTLTVLIADPAGAITQVTLNVTVNNPAVAHITPSTQTPSLASTGTNILLIGAASLVALALAGTLLYKLKKKR